MSGTLKALRLDLKTLLEGAGLQAFDHLPSTFTPPAAVVLHGSPYLAVGQTFGEHVVTFDVELVAGYSAANEVTTDDLDDLIDKAVLVLLEDGWTLGDIAKPSILDVQGGKFLAVPITVSTPIRLS